MSTSGILRIIDASLNRAGEGLRVLEDVARLLLDDSELMQQLKTLRHDLVRGDVPFNLSLIRSRDATGDVGMDVEATGDKKEKDLPTVVIANSRRVQEALRTLEEMAKLPDAPHGLDSEKFKHARFAVYSIEQRLLLALLRGEKLKRIKGLYAITDTVVLHGRSHIEAAQGIISGGGKIIRLRDKTTPKEGLLPLARSLKALCSKEGVLFIIGGYLDIALAVAADSLHLGPDALPVKEARRLMPADMLLGCSVTTAAEATIACGDGADYLEAGAIYPTSTKDSTLIGIEGLKQIRQAVKVPLVAAGGINRQNIAEVIAAGADAAAVIIDSFDVDDIADATGRLIDEIEAGK